MIKEFRLPELGENISSGDIVSVNVTKGDKVEADQVLLEIETDKATIEVPAPFAGTVQDIHVEAGESAQIGQLILTIDEAAGDESAPAKASEPEPETEETPAEEETTEEPAPTKSEAPAKPAAPAPTPEPAQPRQPLPSVERGRKIAPASPTVRRFAREIGVEINEVPGTGPGGRISVDDIKRFSRDLNARRSRGTAIGGVQLEQPPLPDFTKWGEINVEAMSNIRKSTAKTMTNSWTSIPHVTNHDKADITDLEKLRKSFSPKAEEMGAKLTVTAILVKIMASALRVFPQFNSSIDMERNEIIYKNYYNIGVAVDTERGLLVPVIRDVDRKNILEIAGELNEVAEKARNKKLGIEDMQGGCMTITNLGGIGGNAFTPIVNWPEVAILGVSRGAQEPNYINGTFEPRLMLPLSLSYDHRIIDGAVAARFLRWLVSALEQPFMIALEG